MQQTHYELHQNDCRSGRLPLLTLCLEEGGGPPCLMALLQQSSCTALG